MGDRSAIEWTRGDDGAPGATWNPIRARHRETGKVGWPCLRVSPGCLHCFAAINDAAREITGRDNAAVLPTQRHGMVPGGWPLLNVWLGVSVEDRARLSRLHDLRATPAAVRFVSFEPMLEDLGDVDLTGIDQAIYGGESGPDARPCEIAWIRRGLDCCRKSGTAAFVKQLGARPILPAVDPALRGPAVIRAQRAVDMEWPEGTHFGNPTNTIVLNGRVALLRERKGADPREWPSDLKVREFAKEASHV